MDTERPAPRQPRRVQRFTARQSPFRRTTQAGPAPADGRTDRGPQPPFVVCASRRLTAFALGVVVGRFPLLISRAASRQSRPFPPHPLHRQQPHHHRQHQPPLDTASAPSLDVAHRLLRQLPHQLPARLPAYPHSPAARHRQFLQQRPASLQVHPLRRCPGPYGAGRARLSSGPGRATCRPTRAQPVRSRTAPASGPAPCPSGPAVAPRALSGTRATASSPRPSFCRSRRARAAVGGQPVHASLKRTTTSTSCPCWKTAWRAKTQAAVAGHQRLVRRRPADGLAPEAMVIGVAHLVPPPPGAVQPDKQDPAKTVVLAHDQGVVLFPLHLILLLLFTSRPASRYASGTAPGLALPITAPEVPRQFRPAAPASPSAVHLQAPGSTCPLGQRDREAASAVDRVRLLQRQQSQQRVLVLLAGLAPRAKASGMERLPASITSVPPRLGDVLLQAGHGRPGIVAGARTSPRMMQSIGREGVGFGRQRQTGDADLSSSSSGILPRRGWRKTTRGRPWPVAFQGLGQVVILPAPRRR